MSEETLGYGVTVQPGNVYPGNLFGYGLVVVCWMTLTSVVLAMAHTSPDKSVWRDTVTNFQNNFCCAKDPYVKGGDLNP